MKSYEYTIGLVIKAGSQKRADQLAERLTKLGNDAKISLREEEDWSFDLLDDCEVNEFPT